MKKLLIASSFVFATVCSYAANPVNIKHDISITEKNVTNANSLSKPKITSKPKAGNKFSCTASISGSLGPSYASITVTCSATADDCASATSQAVGCVKNAMTAVKKALMK